MTLEFYQPKMAFLIPCPCFTFVYKARIGQDESLAEKRLAEKKLAAKDWRRKKARREPPCLAQYP
jgi:hypothetical protein